MPPRVPARLPWPAAPLAACLVLLGPGAPARAQSPPQPDQPPVYQLTLEAAPEIKNGKIAAVQGTANAAGEKLMLGGLSILQPVAISLVAQFPSDDLRIELSKFATDAPVRSGSTKGEGVCTFQFRTEGDVQIKVTSPEGPKPFRLVAWAGDEVAAELPPVFSPVKANTAGAGAAQSDAGSTPVVLWVIAGGIVLCAGLLAIMVVRRRSS